MKKRELIELLNDHAEALNKGKKGSQILSNYQLEDNVELALLLQLAEEVKAALIPVGPVPAFREQLQRRLEAYEPSNVTFSTSNSGRKQKLLFVAVAGSTLSVAGLFVVLFRRLRSAGNESAQPAHSAA